MKVLSKKTLNDFSVTCKSSYPSGFNGKENDNEINGVGNQQDYGMRTYDPRLGKFLSVDPLTKDYPWYTPYQFAGNTPIQAIDLDGCEPKYINKDKYTVAGSDHTFNGNPHYKPQLSQYYLTVNRNSQKSNQPGLIEYGNATNSNETTATKSSGKLLGIIDVEQLLEYFDIINVIPEGIKPEVPKPDEFSVGEKLLEFGSNHKLKGAKDDSAEKNDTTVKLPHKVWINSWHYGSDKKTVLKDTTVKKEEVKNLPKEIDETN